MSSNKPIVKITFDGSVSVVSRDSNVFPVSCAVDSDGNLWTIEKATGEADFGLYKITSPGSGSDVVTEYYTLSDMTLYNVAGTSTYWHNMKIYGDNLYFIYGYSGDYTNYQIVKFTDITGTAARSFIDTGFAIASYHIHDILIESDTVFYITLSNAADTYRYVYKFYYEDSAWSSTEVVGAHSFVGVYHYETIGDIRPLQKNNYGLYVLGGVVNGGSDELRLYDSTWSQVDTVDLDDLTGAVGFGNFVGDEQSERTFTICGYTSDNVYKVYSTDVVIGDTEPTLKNTIVHIVSNYNDFGAPNEKRVCGVYLPVRSEYASAGSFSLEPDYGVNDATHVHGEASEPSGSVSMRPFTHPGEKTWSYTNSAFDSSVEAWEDIKLDVGYRCKGFRYAIRMGDAEGALPGTLCIRPPYADVQILSKQ